MSNDRTHIVVTLNDPPARRDWCAELQRCLPEAVVFEDSVDSPAPARERATIAVGWLAPRDFFQRHRHLHSFYSMAAGVEHLLRHPGLPAQLTLVRLEDAGMAIQIGRYCAYEAVGHWQRREQFRAAQARAQWTGSSISISDPGCRIGVFGAGVIGQGIARALTALEFDVALFSRRGKPCPPWPVHSGDRAALKAFLARLDMLVLAAPATPDTTDLFDADLLSALPRGAALVNVGRGALIVEDDLLALLDSGHLAGATLDVFRTEPLPPQSRFWQHSSVRVTPHIAGVTLVDRAAAQIAGKIRDQAAGRPISGLVDRSAGY